ncbi:ABC transporter permease [Fulvivirgaceae bacterium BMA12]|uniref:ABC transporter permease n=1 Tax=Agaribacillus aureus TaxID=3051825 RepID=A0ABT8LAU7_9BACT|nr:ABC transporter permease [Fulvivirgaceae bacterium BMA12]
MKPTPPKNALKFLRWFCREEYLEEIEGDLVELYEDDYKKSPTRANWKFARNVIKFFRPVFIRSLKKSYHSNHQAIFRHNFLLTYRTFRRYKTSFLVNLIGLSTGMACTLFIYLWVNDELNVDKFYQKDRQLFQVMEHHERSYGIWTSPTTSGLIATTLASEMPEVVYAAATGGPAENISLSAGENYIRANGHYVGKDFFNVFSYHFIHGDKSRMLLDKNAIVISEALAVKLFNTTENLLGQVIEFEREKQFFISGIYKTLPSNASDRFDFALSYELYEEMYPSVLKWGNTGNRVYLILKAGTNTEEFNRKIADYVKVKTNNRITFRKPFIKRYSEKYLYGKYKDGVQAGGRIEYVRLFSIIAIFILVIACINFMNLSTAKASRRIKEVGIKKAVGAGRKSLVFQYLNESLAMAFLSLILAITLVFLLLPQFNEITGKHLLLNFDYSLVVSLLGITLITGLISGSYPALYLSGFKPAPTLKGKINNTIGGLWVREGLVIFQFAISVILILSVLVIYKQIEFIQTKNLGFNRDNIISFKREGKLLESTSLETFLSEVRRQPGVISASSIRHNLAGHTWGVGGFNWEGRDPEDQTEFEVIAVNYDMIETLGIEMLSGRGFAREFGDDWKNLIFNEAAIDLMGLKDPVGKSVDWGFDDRKIIGVAKNFHFESLHENIKPVVIALWQGRTDRLMVRIKAGRELETVKDLQEFYQAFNPGFSFDYKFLDQDYQVQYVAEQRIATLSRYFAGLAILISCLGLSGLTIFDTQRRIKEIGIRKILGLSTFGIVRHLSGDFTKMVLIAIVIALPLSYFVASNWLESFAYRIDLKWWFFAGAGSFALLIAWFTTGIHTVKVARANPAQCLKHE